MHARRSIPADARRRVGGQMRANPLVENLERDPCRARRHGAWWRWTRGSRRAISATRRRASSSLSIRGSGCAPASSNRTTSLSSLPKASCARLATISGSRLAPALFVGVAFDVVGLRGEADAVRRAGARGDGREDVDCQAAATIVSGASLFLMLRLRGRDGRVVGDRRDRDEGVDAGRGSPRRRRPSRLRW